MSKLRKPQPVVLDHEIPRIIEALLISHMGYSAASETVKRLARVMADEEDCPELVRLMQKWMHNV